MPVFSPLSNLKETLVLTFFFFCERGNAVDADDDDDVARAWNFLSEASLESVVFHTHLCLFNDEWVLKEKSRAADLV